MSKQKPDATFSIEHQRLLSINCSQIKVRCCWCDETFIATYTPGKQWFMCKTSKWYRRRATLVKVKKNGTLIIKPV